MFIWLEMLKYIYILDRHFYPDQSAMIIGHCIWVIYMKSVYSACDVKKTPTYTQATL